MIDLGGRTVIVVRHGETDWNKIGRLQGQHDVPLNDVGRDQARRNGRALGAHLAAIGKRADDFTWYASPLSRTRETVELIRASLGLEIGDYRTDDRLKEFAFGDWQGEVLSELKRNAPEDYRARRDDKWNFQPPEGESYEMLKQRVLPWLEETEGDLIAVTHGGVIRVLWHILEGRQTATVTEVEVRQGNFYCFGEPMSGWV